MPGPLEGVRVLDFTQYQHGPIGTVMLSELGAEVWKVERLWGDLSRQSEISADGYAKHHETYNRGKRSIALDVRSDAGREVALRLGEHVDVVVENFRPGVMERLGLGYDAFSARNPRVIMASASALGGQGPLASRPGYDVIGQAMGGVMAMQAYGAEEEPRTLPGGFADQIGGNQLCVAILSAIIARNNTGVGQKVETSLFGSQIHLQSRYVLKYLHDGVQHHERRRRMPTFTFYQTRDGKWLVIGVIEQKTWDALCMALDAEFLLTDPRFADREEQDKNREALEPELERLFGQRERDEWIAILADADVPCAPVNSYADLAAEPQAWANGYLAEVDHPRVGRTKVHGVPWRFSATVAEVPAAAPDLGADTDDILTQAGFANEEIVGLRDQGII